MRSWRSWIGWLPKRRGETEHDVGPKAQHRPSSWPLRLRLLSIVTIALLPVAFASYMEGMDRVGRDLESIRERLIANARLAAGPEQNVLAAVEEIARVLANLPQVKNVTSDCNTELAAALQGLSFVNNIARIDAKGTVVCSARPDVLGRDVSKLRSWRMVTSHSGFGISGQTMSLVGRPIILIMLPMRDSAGQLSGALDMGIDVKWIDFMVRRSKLPPGAVVALFDHQGNIIASNDSTRAVGVFRRGAITQNATAVHAATDRQGQIWIYATAALLGDSVFVGFAIPEAGALRPTYIHVGADFGLPLVMLSLTWLAIWIGTEGQITHWIVYLRRIAVAYSAGHYAIRPKLAGAPTEFRVLGETLSAMAESICERDRSLRDALAQKSLLIKEVHHRVKNNLQIVMSLLSLQARRLNDPAALDALQQSRARINALALVHRILYEIEDQRVVDIRSLLEQLAEQTREGFGGERRDIRAIVDAEAIDLPGGSAVPIALFVVEALTNAYKHAFPAGRSGTILVSLHRAEGSKLELAVADDGIGLDEGTLESSIGGRLIATFGQQLGGTVRIRSRSGEGTVVDLVFPEQGATETPPAPANSEQLRAAG